MDDTLNQQIKVSYQLALLAGLDHNNAGLAAAKTIAHIHGLTPMQAIGFCLMVGVGPTPTADD